MFRVISGFEFIIQGLDYPNFMISVWDTDIGFCAICGKIYSGFVDLIMSPMQRDTETELSAEDGGRLKWETVRH